MTVHQRMLVLIEIALRFVIKFNVVETQSVDRIIVIMRAAIVWMDIVVILWLHAKDPNVQQTTIAHSTWPVSTNAVKILAIVHQVLSAVSIITLQRVNVCRDTLVMHTQDALQCKLNRHHSVRLTPIAHRNWRASVMCAKILASKQDRVELMPFARLLIRSH